MSKGKDKDILAAMHGKMAPRDEVVQELFARAASEIKPSQTDDGGIDMNTGKIYTGNDNGNNDKRGDLGELSHRGRFIAAAAAFLLVVGTGGAVMLRSNSERGVNISQQTPDAQVEQQEHEQDENAPAETPAESSAEGSEGSEGSNGEREIKVHSGEEAVELALKYSGQPESELTDSRWNDGFVFGDGVLTRADIESREVTKGKGYLVTLVFGGQGLTKRYFVTLDGRVTELRSDLADLADGSDDVTVTTVTVNTDDVPEVGELGEEAEEGVISVTAGEAGALRSWKISDLDLVAEIINSVTMIESGADTVGGEYGTDGTVISFVYNGTTYHARILPEGECLAIRKGGETSAYRADRDTLKQLEDTVLRTEQIKISAKEAKDNACEMAADEELRRGVSGDWFEEGEYETELLLWYEDYGVPVYHGTAVMTLRKETGKLADYRVEYYVDSSSGEIISKEVTIYTMPSEEVPAQTAEPVSAEFQNLKLYASDEEYYRNEIALEISETEKAGIISVLPDIEIDGKVYTPAEEQPGVGDTETDKVKPVGEVRLNITRADGSQIGYPSYLYRYSDSYPDRADELLLDIGDGEGIIYLPK